MGHGARTLIDRLRMRQDNVKSLGQHFLNNEEILDETMALANVSVDDHVRNRARPRCFDKRLLDTGCTLTA